MHWCSDETTTLLAVLGFSPLSVAWLRGQVALVRAWWRTR
jgi:hypothetical protein